MSRLCCVSDRAELNCSTVRSGTMMGSAGCCATTGSLGVDWGTLGFGGALRGELSRGDGGISKAISGGASSGVAEDVADITGWPNAIAGGRFAAGFRVKHPPQKRAQAHHTRIAVLCGVAARRCLVQMTSLGCIFTRPKAIQCGTSSRGQPPK